MNMNASFNGNKNKVHLVKQLQNRDILFCYMLFFVIDLCCENTVNYGFPVFLLKKLNPLNLSVAFNLSTFSTKTSAVFSKRFK